MYTIDHRDRVEVLPGIPQSSTGAPHPMVLAAEGTLVLAFRVEDYGEDQHDATADSPGHTDDTVALVEFVRPYAHLFGPPNDEAFAGHPLAARGLEPYGAFKVLDSSWVRALERMNSVHRRHDPEAFRSRQHFVFSFHDSVFECVAQGFRCSTHPGPLGAVVTEAQRRLLPGR